MVEELPAWLAPTHRRHTLADPALAGVSDLDRPGLIQRVHEAADHPTATLPDLPCRGRRQRLEPPLLVDTASRPLCPSDRPPRIGITHPANQAVSPQKVSGTFFPFRFRNPHSAIEFPLSPIPRFPVSPAPLRYSAPTPRSAAAGRISFISALSPVPKAIPALWVIL